MSVMNVKRNTQAFSKAENQTPAFRSNESVQTNSATDLQKAYGDQDVGEVLNKISDPNWVDPSKKIRAVGDPNMGKDAFMKLMLTQMKYQDPSNPMQSHEMAAQLAQFTSLEQLSNMNTTLEAMRNQASPQTNYQALALIGKNVSGDSSKVNRAVGDTKHAISFELLGDAANVKVTVRDATGGLVRKLEFGAMKKGRNSVEWNGVKDDGMGARPGEYRITVEGVNNTGGKIFAKTAFGGRITGMNFTNEGPVLMVGNQSIKLSEVRKIEDAGGDEAPGAVPATPLEAGQKGAKQAPTVEQQGKDALKAMAQSGKAPVAAAPNKTVQADDNVPPAEEDPAPGNIMGIPMAPELMANLEKQTK